MDAAEARVASLKALIASPVTAGTLGWHFEREVDSLLEQFYDDIGTVKLVSLRSMFTVFLLSRELVRFNANYDFLYSILEEIRERGRFQNLFEASRQMADNALFVT